jgi:hypothetical protein
MKKITSTGELRDAIRLLEEKQSMGGRLLKEHFFIVLESVKPVNIIKNTFKEVASEPDLISNILSTTLGLTAGYISNKTVVGSSGNMLRKLLGTILQFGVTSLIIKNPETIKSVVQSVSELFHRRKDTE